jgi:polysaccharide biosynthesis transport protein
VVPNASTRERRIRDAGAILLRHIEITPVRLSRLVNLSFSSPDPGFSARVAGAWSTTFINITLERRLDATSYARRFLEGRLEQLRRRLNESEQRLVGYAQRENIINLPGGSGPNGATNERSIAADDLTSLNAALATAVSDRIQAESALQAGGGTASSTTSPTLSGLRTRRADVAADYAKLLTQFEPGYPPAQALRDQIASLDRAIAREEGRDKGTLRTAYNAAVEREQSLQRRVEALKGNVLDLRRRSIQYNIYQRDVDTNRQLYDALLQRYKEIGVAGGVGVNNISVVDPAQVPLGPSSPRPLINLLIALAAGIGLGVLIALVLEQLDDALSDPTEMSQKLSLPVLGIIPNIGSEDMLGTLVDRKSELSEAYLAAQTALSFSTQHGFPRSLMVTSSAPAEGKSTTAHALALSLQRTGKRVILVDGDMRSPSVHHMVGVANERGLSNFLAGDEDVEELVRWNTPGIVPAITAGPQPPNAAELLAGTRFITFIERLHESFDHIIVDAPPVMGLADAPLMGHQLEGAVFAVRAHHSRVSAARVAIRRMVSGQTRIFGGILTRYDAKRSFYGYGYDYGHSYGYGSNDRKG